MIRFLLNQFQFPESAVIISLDTNSPHDSAVIQYEGEELFVKEIQQWLPFESGVFGHSIGNSTTPIDLHRAMLSTKAAAYNPQLLEGAELVTSYDSGIPEGAVT